MTSRLKKHKQNFNAGSKVMKMHFVLFPFIFKNNIDNTTNITNIPINFGSSHKQGSRRY